MGLAGASDFLCLRSTACVSPVLNKELESTRQCVYQWRKHSKHRVNLSLFWVKITMKIPLGKIAWIVLKHMLHKFQISSRQDGWGWDSTKLWCPTYRLSGERESNHTRERERERERERFSSEGSGGQVYKQTNLTEKTTHELMQWCVVDPQPSLMLQKHLLKHTTWIRTLVVEPTCK